MTIYCERTRTNTMILKTDNDMNNCDNQNNARTTLLNGGDCITFGHYHEFDTK